MEYLCHYCKEWQEAVYCQSHFESCHGQIGVTFESLQNRMSCLGGLDTREKPEVEGPKEKKVTNWLWRDGDTTDGVFVTNNFRHNLE
jgi:hypothetical protein